MAGGKLEKPPPSPSPTTSFSEEYLKTEPVPTSTMIHETDCEFFQDLVQWCSVPAKGEQALTIDFQKPTEARALNTDTKHTPISPQGWEIFDANSPLTPAGLYPHTPNDPLSPTMEGFMFDSSDFLHPADGKKMLFQEQVLDINSLPVVFEDFASEKPVSEAWLAPQPSEWATQYTVEQDCTQNILPFIDQEDSLDMKLTSVIPRQVESNDVVVSEFVLNPPPSLALNVAARASPQVISTPEVLSYVEQLEKLPLAPQAQSTLQWTETDSIDAADTCINASVAKYEPITPKSESPAPSDSDQTKRSKRKRHNSEDSDESYTPITEYTPRKYKRRKPRLPIKDMILALEGSQQLPKARRGRPPKRRESAVSSTCSVDDNVSTGSTHEIRYRELRDKNNEASKRSRMNRKLKELQMEQQAIELEESNKRLRVRADVLEDMTKRLKDALMTAILQK